MTARVLVVDDILANVKLLEARLTAEYFDVLTANSGREALDVLAKERVDLVLLDVMMPGLDGFETCRRIKANAKMRHVPVVMVTALDQPSDKVQGLEAGADDFLTKPVDDVALITRVKNLTRLKVLNDEMQVRTATSKQFGGDAGNAADWSKAGTNGRILVLQVFVQHQARLEFTQPILVHALAHRGRRQGDRRGVVRCVAEEPIFVQHKCVHRSVVILTASMSA